MALGRQTAHQPVPPDTSSAGKHLSFFLPDTITEEMFLSSGIFWCSLWHCRLMGGSEFIHWTSVGWISPCHINQSRHSLNSSGPPAPVRHPAFLCNYPFEGGESPHTSFIFPCPCPARTGSPTRWRKRSLRCHEWRGLERLRVTSSHWRTELPGRQRGEIFSGSEKSNSLTVLMRAISFWFLVFWMYSGWILTDLAWREE